MQLLGSGTILREVEAAADLLATEHGVAADVWSCPSFTELGRDTVAVDRWNLLHPGEHAAHRLGHASSSSERPAGPVVAATDYMRAFAEQIRPSVPADRRYVVLGTDGFGRSDYRKALRRHFEVDRQHVVVATLAALAADGAVPASAVTRRDRPLRHRPGQARPGPRLTPRTGPPAHSRQVGEEAPCPRQPQVTEVQVPDIGDFSDVPIIEVHVAPGDKVNAEDPLLTLESDKATLDVPAPSAGTVGEVLVKVGDEVSEGTPILLLSSGDGASDHSPVAGRAAGAGARARRRPTPVAEAVGAPLAAPPAVSGAGRRSGTGRGARRPERAADGPRAGRRPVGGRPRRGRRAGSPRTTCWAS